MSEQARVGFWKEAFSLQGAVAPKVVPLVLAFGLIAGVVVVGVTLIEKAVGRRLELQITPHELAGAALGLLLVMRTNAGYDRWWEARKLWGGFVDRTRNFIISAMAYGSKERKWREQVAIWTAVYPHVARLTLRGMAPDADVVRLVGADAADQLAKADHMPCFVSMKLANLLEEARTREEMDSFGFLQVDRERVLLIDNYGGCERILLTPLPRVYSIKIRHFIVLFLLTLPFALLHRLDSDWLVPFLTMLVAYPLLSLDQIGIELENPFATSNLSHLPIDRISATIERNVLAVMQLKQADPS